MTGGALGVIDTNRGAFATVLNADAGLGGLTCVAVGNSITAADRNVREWACLRNGLAFTTAIAIARRVGAVGVANGRAVHVVIA